MSNTHTVFEFMKGLSDTAVHERKAFDQFIVRHAETSHIKVNMREAEKDVISQVERQIIQNLECPAKFTRQGFSEAARVAITTTCIPAAAEHAPECLDRTYELNFLSDYEWFMNPMAARVSYSNRGEVTNLADRAARGRILAACPGMSANEDSGLLMRFLGEKMATPKDLTHIFMKLYLLLQDYTLGITSKTTEKRVYEDFAFVASSNVIPSVRVAYMAEHDIVVDSDEFTPQELSVLGVGCSAYPSVTYGGDNIFTRLQFEADDYRFVSRGIVDVDRTLDFGSPDRLYDTIIKVACKLGAVEDMMSAFRVMRGKAKMLADMGPYADSNEIQLNVSRSHSLLRALGGYEPFTYSNQEAAGFLSTSLSLVSELVFGHMFKLVASLVAEQLGATGSRLTKGDPRTDRTIGGLAREFGLNHTDLQVNTLLVAWESLAGGALSWGFGGLTKPYVLRLAHEIKNKQESVIPQLLAFIPFLPTVDTTWGAMRGWHGRASVLDNHKEARDLADRLTANLLWVLGVREVRPNLFHNRGRMGETVFNSTERKLLARVAKGRVGSVRLYMADSLGGRIDESENSATNLFSTAFAGDTCTLVYNYHDDAWLQSVENPDEQTQRETYHRSTGAQTLNDSIEVDETPIRAVTVGGGRIPADQGLAKLKALAGNEKVTVLDEPEFLRDNQGRVGVMAYSRSDGKMTTEPRPVYAGMPAVGSEVDLTPIPTPGDGRCGIHAIVQDLSLSGLIKPADSASVFNNFAGRLDDSTFHQAEELGAAVMELGIGLDLYDVQPDGQAVLLRYGGPDVHHRARVIREGNHFSTGLAEPGKRLRLRSVVESDVDNAKQLRAINEMRKFFRTK